TLTVADVMTSDPVLVREDASLSTLLAEMRRIGARRMPIVDADGLLVGVVSLDDVLERLAEELGNIAGSIQHGQRQESVLRTCGAPSPWRAGSGRKRSARSSRIPRTIPSARAPSRCWKRTSPGCS